MFILSKVKHHILACSCMDLLILTSAHQERKAMVPDEQTSESIKYEFILVAFLIYTAFYYLHDKAYETPISSSEQNHENFEIKGYIHPAYSEVKAVLAEFYRSGIDEFS